ncbi:hypothetical protein JCM10908_004134 [Rhodotorula pacifica]|uniref:ERMES complex subunit MMM1 n=1 Tax=Rhodotorula pacifica TaxID=1495444 RepID=UPI00318001DE
MHPHSAPPPAGYAPPLAPSSLPLPPSVSMTSTATPVVTHAVVQASSSTGTSTAALGFSFTQGILLGQASMVVLAVLFLRYVVFEDPEISKRANEERRQKRNRARSRSLSGENGHDRLGRGEVDGGRRIAADRERKGKGKAATAAPDSATSATDASTLLESLAYDLSSHAPESLDWLNVLLGQLIGSYRSLAASHSGGGARSLLEEALNRSTLAVEADGQEKAQGMVGLDFIEVDEVELGEAFPVLTDARVRPSGSDSESVRVELDVDYSDRVVLAVSTRVVLNFPRSRFAILPVSLSVSLERFSGTLTVEIPTPVPTPSSAPDSPSRPGTAAHSHPTIHLSLHPDFDLCLATSSLLGSRAKLQDVPKVEQLLVARIRAAIQDRVVWPGRVEVALPSLDRRNHHHHQHHHRQSPAEGSSSSASQQDGVLAQDEETVDSPLAPLSASDPMLSSTPPSLPSPTDEADSEESLTFASDRPRFPLRPSFLSAATSRTSSTATPETPSISLSEAGGPSIALHPRIHPPTPGLTAGGAGAGSGTGMGLTAELLAAATASSSNMPTPSPTETLPGYFASKLGRSALAPQLVPTGAGKGKTTGAATGRAGQLQSGVRHRSGGGLGLV